MSYLCTCFRKDLLLILIYRTPLNFSSIMRTHLHNSLLAVLFAFCLSGNAMYAQGIQVISTDTIRFQDTRLNISENGYVDWTGLKKSSRAVYAGNSGNTITAIQLRANYGTSGIVTTSSGGSLTNVEVEWNENTENGRNLGIYGKNTPYSSPSELYDDATAGKLIGVITNGQNTALSIQGDYKYLGVRSQEFVCYLNSLCITWNDVLIIGDVNSDGNLDVTDVVAIANYVMGSASADFNAQAANVNAEGDIDVSDVVQLANKVLGN